MLLHCSHSGATLRDQEPCDKVQLELRPMPLDQPLILLAKLPLLSHGAVAGWAQVPWQQAWGQTDETRRQAWCSVNPACKIKQNQMVRKQSPYSLAGVWSLFGLTYILDVLMVCPDHKWMFGPF